MFQPNHALDRLRSEIDLPKDWNIFWLQNPGAFEISGFEPDGEIERKTLEVLVGDHITETSSTTRICQGERPIQIWMS